MRGCFVSFGFAKRMNCGMQVHELQQARPLSHPHLHTSTRVPRLARPARRANTSLPHFCCSFVDPLWGLRFAIVCRPHSYPGVLGDALLVELTHDFRGVHLAFLEAHEVTIPSLIISCLSFPKRRRCGVRRSYLCLPEDVAFRLLLEKKQTVSFVRVAVLTNHNDIPFARLSCCVGNGRLHIVLVAL